MFQTFEDYSASFMIHCDIGMLDLSMRNSEFCICEGSQPLKTPSGNLFSHPSEGKLRLILTDFQMSDGTQHEELMSPLLFSFGKDIIETGDDPFLHNWKSHLASDPFVLIKTTGKSSAEPFGEDDPLFAFSFVSLTGLIGSVNYFISRVMAEISLDENDAQPFDEILRLSYDRLSADEKVVLQALSGLHHSGIVLPLLLVLGEISPVEFVKGLISLKILPKKLFSDTLATVVRVLAFTGSVSHKSLYDKYISDIIISGEGDSIEFKSTLRWDIRAGKTNQAVERACLKTISAFLNSLGGCLLIGVRDDGSIEGIESDKFPNEDKFLLHLWTLIRTCLGRDFSSYIRTRIEKIEEKSVCVVDCLPASRPAFLRQPGFNEEMYIRVGPSSNALDISEALKYIEDHFQNK